MSARRCELDEDPRTTTRILRTVGYGLIALAAGPAIYASLGLLPWMRWIVTTPWIGPLRGSPRQVACAFAVTSVLIAYMFRRRIVAGPVDLAFAFRAQVLGGALVPVIWSLVCTRLAVGRPLDDALGFLTLT